MKLEANEDIVQSFIQGIKALLTSTTCIWLIHIFARSAHHGESGALARTLATDTTDMNVLEELLPQCWVLPPRDCCQVCLAPIDLAMKMDLYNHTSIYEKPSKKLIYNFMCHDYDLCCLFLCSAWDSLSRATTCVAAPNKSSACQLEHDSSAFALSKRDLGS